MEVSFHLLRPLPPSPSPLPRRSLVFPLRRPRLRPLSFVRNSADEPESPADARPESAPAGPAVFGGKKELTPLQAALDAMAPPVRLASSVVVVAGALAAGYGLGFRVGGSRSAGAGGAAALGAAGGALAYAINSCAPEVAAANLHNYVAGCDDPGEVKREVVEEIPKRYSDLLVCFFCVLCVV